MKRLSRIVLVGIVFASLAVFSSFPLVLRLSAVVPGTAGGDNLAGLWNTWWFVRAVVGDGDLFRTELLFAPVGTQLSLHTHSTLHSVLAWPWTSLMPVSAAHNLAILIGLVLNGAVTAALAYDIVRRLPPALLAGWLFAASAFVHVHLLGHMNLLHAWVIPLYVLALLRWLEDPRIVRAVVLGLAGALVVYADYYFAIYCALMTAAVVMSRSVDLKRPAAGLQLGVVGRTLLLLGGGALLVAGVIALTGGGSLEWGAIHLSLRTARNPLNIAWVLLIAAVLWARPLRIRFSRKAAPHLRTMASAAVAAAVIALVTAPLLISLTEVVLGGDYAAAQVLWRSSAPGADVSTLVLGHPGHALSGGWTRGAYERLEIDVMEQSLWLGIVPLVLLVAWRRAWCSDPAAKTWILIGALFAVLALGPFLRVGGTDTGLTLPFAVLRYVPGLSNARIPGRAVVIVQLSMAVLVAIAWSRRRPGPAVGTAVVLLVIIEFLPGRLPLYLLPHADAVDYALAAASDGGAVIELPTGLRDGFGERGSFDHRALIHQMVHGRPLAGGFVARLSPQVIRQYEADPLLSAVLNLSSVDPPSQPAVPLARDLAGRGFSHLVINRDRIGVYTLSRESLEAAGFVFVGAAGDRQLFRTSP